MCPLISNSSTACDNKRSHRQSFFREQKSFDNLAWPGSQIPLTAFSREKSKRGKKGEYTYTHEHEEKEETNAWFYSTRGRG